MSKKFAYLMSTFAQIHYTKKRKQFNLQVNLQTN